MGWGVWCRVRERGVWGEGTYNHDVFHVTLLLIGEKRGDELLSAAYLGAGVDTRVDGFGHRGDSVLVSHGSCAVHPRT